MNKYIVSEDAKDIIGDILKLDKQFYKDEYLWSEEYQRKIYDKNKESFILLFDNDKLIGYLNYLCITKEKYDEIINSDVTIDEFDLDDIKEYTKGENYISINSIVIDKEYQNKGLVKMINNSFLLKLNELRSKGFEISGINGIAISNDGQKYFEKLGFSKIKQLDNNNFLYKLEKNKIEILKKLALTIDKC